MTQPRFGPLHLVWGPPPDYHPDTYPPLPHHLISQALRERPREWAEIVGSYVGLSYSITKGTIAGYRPAGTFQAVEIRGRVWARYLGE